MIGYALKPARARLTKDGDMSAPVAEPAVEIVERAATFLWSAQQNLPTCAPVRDSFNGAGPDFAYRVSRRSPSANSAMRILSTCGPTDSPRSICAIRRRRTLAALAGFGSSTRFADRLAGGVILGCNGGQVVGISFRGGIQLTQISLSRVDSNSR